MVRGLEDWLLDGSFVIRAKRPSSTKILLVDIDDQSLDKLKKPLLYLSPELAEVVSYLSDQGAASIGVDVLISASYSDVPALKEGAAGDATKMGLAIERSGKVVLPEWLIEGQTLLPLRQWQLKSLDTPDPDGTDIAFVNLTEDGDQFVRRQRLAAADRQNSTIQFALALVAKATHQSISYDAGRNQLRLGGRPIRLDAEDKLRINFVGPPGGETFPIVTLSRVLESARQRQPVSRADGAIVIIGSVGQGGQDVHNTPYSNRYADYFHRLGGKLMSGPEVHANVAATIQDRAFIRTPWWLSSLPWLLVLGAVLGHAFFRLGPVSGFVLAVVHHFGWKIVALVAFWTGHWRVEMGAMLILGALAYSVAFAWRWRVLRQVLRAVKSAPIAQALEMDPGRLRLGGESREISVFFADIRDFTTFSERHTPAQVVDLLNAYFGVVIPLIEAEGGVINQFMGDGIMVLFGAVPARPDHAAAAVRAARATVRAVEANQSLWASHGFGGMRIGIGIHTGPVLLGAVGSPTRLDFTAIGDTTNAAARVEGENKRFGSSILITATTCAAVPAGERTLLGIREQTLAATVKGKEDMLTLHMVGDPKEGVGI
jgi:adenylate cyclase